MTWDCRLSAQLEFGAAPLADHGTVPLSGPGAEPCEFTLGAGNHKGGSNTIE